MTGMLLQLSLCIVTVIQLTSSQPTYDISQQDNDCCGQMAHVHHVLRQLQKDVAELKTDKRKNNITGESYSVKRWYMRIYTKINGADRMVSCAIK